MLSRSACSFLISVGLVWLACGGPACAQNGPTPTPLVTVTPAPTPAMPSVSEMMADVESTQQLLDSVDSRRQQDAIMQGVENQLTSFTLLINQESLALTSKLALEPSMEQLNDLEVRWKGYSSSLAAWKGQLNADATNLDSDMGQLQEFTTKWRQALRNPGPFPLSQELQNNIVVALGHLRTALGKAESERAELLNLLARLGGEEARLNSALDSIRAARKALADEFLMNDSEPLWAIDFRAWDVAQFGHQTSISLTQHSKEVKNYLRDHGNRLLLQGLAFGVLYLTFAWSRPRIRQWIEQEPELAGPAGIFQAPVSLSLLLAILLGHWLHQDAPLVVRAGLAVAALIPGLVILVQILPARFRPGMFCLAFLFLVDVIRLLLTPHVLLNRVIFTMEVGTALGCFLWRFLSLPNQVPSNPWEQRLRGLAVLLFGTACLAVNLGFVRLAYLLGDATLRSIYVAYLLVCLVRVGDGLLMFWLHSKPMCLLPSVRSFGPLYLSRLQGAIRILALAFWLHGFLDRVGILPSLLPYGTEFLGFGIHVRSLHITLGGILVIAVSLWLPYQMSRLASFSLEQDIGPQLNLTRGETYTLSSLVYYLLLSGGLLAGLLAIGLDMTQFTVVAGALSVGIGFGMQNIVNNFVSGMILLLERPMQVGDSIEVAGQTGTLEKIGLRASVLRTPEGSEIIVPNGDLISTRVTNWTHSDQRRLLCIDVGVGYGTSAEQVEQVLLEVAAHHPAIMGDPAPAVVFRELGDSAILFQLRAWTEHYSSWVKTRSELVRGVYTALNKAEIEIPFPQRTLHLENWPGPGSAPLP